MAMNKESNAYTVIFAIVMVVVIGGLLAFVAESMKPAIKANRENEKKQNILQAMGVSFEEIGENEKLDRPKAQEIFYKYVTRRITLDYDGNILSDLSSNDSIDSKNKIDAFNIDLRKEYKLYGKKVLKKFKGDKEALAKGLKKEDRIHYPFFVCEQGDSTFYVIPAVGTGLWDDVWGYVGLSSDCGTIHGSVFDHAAETPGLGSKVTEDWFQDQFVGKRVRDENNDPTKLKVKKPGNELSIYEVDGISGATFTGAGVAEMLERSFGVYHKFFEANKDEFIK
ncbi:MAG: Na+-transporting NADH:ubiquinone oxidoreductase subunit C [Parvicellaceae bacterium]|jgi:Na+-transporting NADH:ubiquinone oxidoreductase subunit C